MVLIYNSKTFIRLALIGAHLTKIHPFYRSQKFMNKQETIGCSTVVEYTPCYQAVAGLAPAR